MPLILARLVSLPLVLARYDSQFPIGAFAFIAGVGLLVAVLISFGAALLAVALVLAVKRDAAAAFRRGGADGPRALAAGAGAAALILSIRALARGLEASFPLEAGVPGFPFPAGIETVLPAAAAISSLILRMLLFGGSAAFLALLLRDALKKPVFRVAFFVAAIGVFAPFGARTFGELFVPVFAGALTGLAFLAALAVFLRDDPRAYAVAAALLAAAGAGVDLVSSGIAPWVWSGASVLAVVALLVALLGLDRPRPVSA
jgi:hypothetical protein